MLINIEWENTKNVSLTINQVHFEEDLEKETENDGFEILKVNHQYLLD